jgi:succinate-acetate transporter protein
MVNISHDETGTVQGTAAPEPVTAPAEPAASPLWGGDPLMLGLPIFVVGSVALGFSLIGYVPASAASSIVPIIFAATGLGLAVSTIWAATLGQTMVASVFGLFSGFWFSFAVLLLGLDHNWFLIPAASVVHSVGLYLISWTIVFAFLTLALMRLPAAFSVLVGLVVVALILRTIGVLDASSAANHVAAVIVFIFAALGAYLFLGGADAATGGSGLPLGPPLRH